MEQLLESLSKGSAKSKLGETAIRKVRTISPPPGADRGRQNGTVAMIRPYIPVIPTEGRNLKFFTARPDSQCHASIVTESDNNVRILYVSLTLDQTF